MWHSKLVRTKDRGFTLIEMLVTIIVAGVLAAVTAPSLVGLLNRNQVTEAQRQVASALKEAQRQAIRRGRSCRIKIDGNTIMIDDNDNNPNNTNLYSGCLLSDRTVGENTLIGGDKVSLKSNDSNPNIITFSNKGIPDVQKLIVIDSSFSSAKKCIAIIDGLGTVKTGTYTGNMDVELDPDNCDTTN